LEEGGAFRLTLLQPGSGQQVELGAADFHFTAVRRTTALDWLRPSRWLAANGVSSPLGDNLVLDGVAQWNSTTLRLHLHYSFPPEADFVQVQLGLEPTSAAEGWVVSNAASARWQLDTTMNPTPRNPQLDSALYYQKRWKLPPSSLPGNWWVAPNGEGLYAFSNSPFGREYYQPNNLAVLDQYDHQPLSEGFQGGFVVLGYYPSGGAEMGYTRYVQYLTRYVSRMTRQNKRAPVFFNTWIPWTNQIDQKVIDKALDQTKQAGYYDLLHVDAGWEGASSLQLDTKKFPGGLDYIQQKAHAQNLGLGLWINPYSDSYFGYVNYETVHREKRDWHVVLTEGFLPKQGFNRGAFQVLSPYSDYVEERLVDLVSRYDIRMIYWDGADWNIRDSEVDFLDDPARQRLKVLGMKRLMQITERLYAIRPDLMIVAWNAWVDPHLLSIFDQEQVTDIFAAPVGEAELSRRKVYYGMSYIMPFSTIWSDWYGLAYSERKDISNLTLPESQLEYAELSMLSKGLKEAGGTLDLQQVRPEFRVFLKTLFTFRQRFDRYFEVYQRLSDLPDANRADASGHFLDGKGFIILNNPSNISQQLQLTLDPALLGLTPGKTYQLYDWTDLKFAKRYSALSFNSDGRSASLALHLPPHTVRILALDISGNEPRNPLPAQVREGS
ncbi:MAG: alpha-galactosidase, partial [Chloroflexota bacterium]